jgi:hypothetical protein
MVCIFFRRYDILDVWSVLVLRKATTSNLTIYGLIQPTIEPKIYRTEMTTLTIAFRMRILFIFYFSLDLNIHRCRSRPGNQSLPASTDAPIEVTTSTYIVFTNDLQIVYNNKITGLKNIIIIMFITCLFYTDLGLNIYIDIESINFKIKFSEMIN